MEKFKAPNLAVIDLAIEKIKSGSKHYSCHALHAASLTVEGSRVPRQDFYADQYEKYVFKKAKRTPIWWNHWAPQDPVSMKRAKTSRIRALQGFKQACIDAARKNTHD